MMITIMTIQLLSRLTKRQIFFELKIQKLIQIIAFAGPLMILSAGCHRSDLKNKRLILAIKPPPESKLSPPSSDAASASTGIKSENTQTPSAYFIHERPLEESQNKNLTLKVVLPDQNFQLILPWTNNEYLSPNRELSFGPYRTPYFNQFNQTVKDQNNKILYQVTTLGSHHQILLVLSNSNKGEDDKEKAKEDLSGALWVFVRNLDKKEGKDDFTFKYFKENTTVQNELDQLIQLVEITKANENIQINFINFLVNVIEDITKNQTSTLKPTGEDATQM